MADREASISLSSYDGGELNLLRMTCTERLNEPYTIIADVLQPNPDDTTEAVAIDFLPLLGSDACITMSAVEGIVREFDGWLFEAEELSQDNRGITYRLIIRPWLAALAGNLTTRIFQDMTVIDIAKKVVAPFGSLTSLTSGVFKTREYCVQYRESDLAFLSRLLEEEGVVYYFEHADGQAKLYLTDAASAHHEFGEAPFFPPNIDASQVPPHFRHWTKRTRPGPKTATLNDMHYAIPSKVQSAVKEAGQSSPGRIETSELYDFPGGYARFGEVADNNQTYVYADSSSTVGAQFAIARLQAARADRERFIGEGNIFAVACGQRVTLTQHAQSPYNQSYLITATVHVLSGLSYVSGSEAHELHVEVECVPEATPWRPPQRTPKPVAGGLHTATVVGPPGEQVYVDAHGRVKVMFPWDRSTAAPETRTCWLRVSQGWADGEWGMITIPRVGQEVLVDFLHGDPDWPIIVGRVYNAEKMPPYPLPDKRTVSTWKSNRVGASGSYPDTVNAPDASAPGFNELRFEDAGGSEEVFIHAQRNLTAQVRFDETYAIGHIETRTIGFDRNTTIKHNEVKEVQEGDETHTVTKGSRTTTIHTNEALTVETGNHSFTVSQGNSTNAISAGSYDLTAAKAITITSDTSIELTVGQSTIKLTPTAIQISSMSVTVDGQLEAKVNSSAQTTVTAGAKMTISGAIVMIN